MKMTEELWYGNIVPFEQYTRNNNDIKWLIKLSADNYDNLNKTLSEKQKELLNIFNDSINELHSNSEAFAFSYGFRLGLRLSSEAFLNRLE